MPAAKSATCAKPRRSSSRAHAFERHVDRRPVAHAERDDHAAARRRHTCELVEERDHVVQRDEVERPVVVRERRRVGDVVALAVRRAGAPRRSSRATRRRRRPPASGHSAGDDARDRAGARAEVEDACAAVSGSAPSAATHRREPLVGDARRVPRRGEPVERPRVSGRAEEPPERTGTRTTTVGHEPREALAGASCDRDRGSRRRRRRPVSPAASPPADRERHQPVGVLVDDQLAAARRRRTCRRRRRSSGRARAGARRGRPRATPSASTCSRRAFVAMFPKRSTTSTVARDLRAADLGLGQVEAHERRRVDARRRARRIGTPAARCAAAGAKTSRAWNVRETARSW